MMSIRKRAAGLGAAVAIIAAIGPVSGASAAPAPMAAPAPIMAPAPTGPLAAAYQAGFDASIGGFNAGTDAAIGGFNAGAAALGIPYQFTNSTAGPFGLHIIGGVAPVQ
jgi:hypothetical protein